jgi:hypothetical protein
MQAAGILMLQLTRVMLLLNSAPRFPVSSLLATVGVVLLPAGIVVGAAQWTQKHFSLCEPRIAVACADSVPEEAPGGRPLPAGDVPAFLFASVQPITAPASWRTIYHEVERCAGKTGDYDRIRWSVMAAPLTGPKGPTFGFTVGERIVLVQNDTTYLRHEMLHHILQTAGWEPRSLQPGEHSSTVDLHPRPWFGLCTAGH